MDAFLIPVHSTCRWLVLASLALAIALSASGYRSRRSFSRWDDQMRHWTATIAHVQLVIGMILYIRSPLASYFWSHLAQSFQYADIAFYGLAHPLLMLLAVVLITLGSALAKRKTESREKHKTVFVWFSVALAIILLAVPWPFSPLSARPYLRSLPF